MKRRVGGDAVGDLAVVAVEHVGDQDLVVVVGGVGEGAAAVRVADREDSLDVGAKLVVDDDVAVRVGRNARLVEAEIVRVRAAADGEEQMAAHDLLRALAAFQADGDAVAAFLVGDAFGVQPDLHAFLLKDRLHRVGHVGVLARDQPVGHLHDGHAAPEAAIHLRELKPDIGAADDDEMLRQEVDVHHRRAGQVVDLFEPRRVRHEGVAADVDDDLRRLEQPAVDADRVRALETAVAVDHRKVGVRLQPFLDVLVRGADDAVLARLDALHVDFDVSAEHHAEIRGAPRDVGGAGACDQRLRRDAADIDAGAAVELALENRDLHALAGHALRDRRPGLAGADDDRVECLSHAPLPDSFCDPAPPGYRAAEAIDVITIVAILNCASRSVIPCRCATQVKSL